MTTRTPVKCDCPTDFHCREALGGEQGLTAEEWELAHLRAETAALRAALSEERRTAHAPTEPPPRGLQ